MRKIITLVSIILILTIVSAVSFAEDYTNEADALNQLGLFEGTNKGYELDRAPTRAEAGVMLIRLLGKEAEVLAGNYSHPFTDAGWADKYIGYMYENGLTEGIGNNLYGSNQLIDSKSYATFVLRALGYKSEVDFTWEQAEDKAVELGLMAYYEKGRDFLRGNMAAISKRALDTSFKGTSKLLKTKLIEDSAITSEAVKLVEKSEFERYYPCVRDLLAKTLYKYDKICKAISTSDLRNEPAMLTGTAFQGSDGTVYDYAAHIRFNEDVSEVYDVIKSILLDLEFSEVRADKFIEEYKTNGSYFHYSSNKKRVAEIKTRGSKPMLIIYQPEE